MNFNIRIIVLFATVLMTAMTFFLKFPLNAFSGGSDAALVKSALEGCLAPDVKLICSDGVKEIKISFEKGGRGVKNPALVWFWYLSCENCIKDMKFMREIYRNYNGKISLISVNVDMPEDRETAANFIKNNGISGYNNYFDVISVTPFAVSYDASDKFGISSTPAVFVIDENGLIRYKAEHIIDFDELENKMKSVIK